MPHQYCTLIINSSQVILPSWRLDWAFAGLSSSTPSDSKPLYTDCKWTHWIDSRHEDPSGVVDQGCMSPEDPYTGTQFETGSMVNPATGLMTDYTEGWREPKAVPTSQEESDDGMICMVLELCDEAQQARGMVIRVGQFVQGVIRVGELFALERWSWVEGWKEGWKLDTRIGDLFLPCGVCTDANLDLGGKVVYGEFEWRVVEVDRF